MTNWHTNLMKIYGKLLVIRVLKKTDIDDCSCWLNI